VLTDTDVYLTVEQLNMDAPIQFRLLCRAVFTLPTGIDLFIENEYLPLDRVAAVAA